jgi:two-component system, OmpR family, sensor histidine kinase SenX3
VTPLALVISIGALVVGAALGWLACSRRVVRTISPLRSDGDSGALGSTLSQAVGNHGRLQTSYERVVTEAKVLRSALDGLRIGVILVGGSNDDGWRNKAAQRLVGSARVEVIVDEAILHQRALALGGASGSQIIEVVGPPKRTFALASVPLPLVGGHRSGVVTIEDLSDLVRLERVRREFVANVSHELRTPVGAIAVLSETLESEHDQAVINRLAAKLVTESHRLSRTITDLLELSVLESSGQALRTAHAAVDLVAEAVTRVEPAASSRKITIDTSAVGHQHQVLCDVAQLVSALGNLVENAVKYSEDGGAVAISTTVEPEQITFAVSDEGVGIPSRDLNRVFERFYRVDTARSRITGGTGLGLAIVRHVAENHGGEVSVDSIEGKGSTFRLVVPRAPDDADLSIGVP